MFLNKQDLLQRKIEQGRRLEKYFPDYSHFKPKQQRNGEVISEYDKARLFMEKKLTVSILAMSRPSILRIYLMRYRICQNRQAFENT